MCSSLKTSGSTQGKGTVHWPWCWTQPFVWFIYLFPTNIVHIAQDFTIHLTLFFSYCTTKRLGPDFNATLIHVSRTLLKEWTVFLWKLTQQLVFGWWLWKVHFSTYVLNWSEIWWLWKGIAYNLHNSHPHQTNFSGSSRVMLEKDTPIENRHIVGYHRIKVISQRSIKLICCKIPFIQKHDRATWVILLYISY